MKLLAAILSILLLISCSGKKDTVELGESETHYASLLKMHSLGNEAVLFSVENPWKAGNLLAQYLLVPTTKTDFDETEFRKKYGESIVLRTPLQRLALTSSCHGYLLHELGAIRNIAVMCETEYVSHANVKKHIENGEIVDGGNGSMPNIETILSKNCDGMIVSPFESSANLSQISPAIPTICAADYMETTPLGRAEWMKFYGAMVGKEAEADSLFEMVVSEYQENTSYPLPLTSSKRKLLVEAPYQGTWFVPGGESTMGILYHDAGFEYPWAEDTHSGSLALSPEAVLQKAQDADVWLIKYYADQDYTLKEFIAQNPFFPQFKAAQRGEIYGCNTKYSDYYDVMPFRPDILFKDLRNLGEGYFKKLK